MMLALSMVWTFLEKKHRISPRAEFCPGLNELARGVHLSASRFLRVGGAGPVLSSSFRQERPVGVAAVRGCSERFPSSAGGARCPSDL